MAESDYLVFGTLAQRNVISRKTIEQLRSFGKINIYDVKSACHLMISM